MTVLVSARARLWLPMCRFSDRGMTRCPNPSTMRSPALAQACATTTATLRTTRKMERIIMERFRVIGPCLKFLELPPKELPRARGWIPVAAEVVAWILKRSHFARARGLNSPPITGSITKTRAAFRSAWGIAGTLADTEEEGGTPLRTGGTSVARRHRNRSQIPLRLPCAKWV